MKNLLLEEVLYIHEVTIKKHGGSNGIKNLGLIESSLYSGLVTFGGEDLYPTLEDKISMITYSFIKNHGFEDGNKRVGCLVLLTLCYKNDILIKPSQQELVDFALGVASGKFEKDYIRQFIMKHKN